MAISGTTSTCQITTNTQFELSGLNQTNLSTINITDENGLDVSECFGIETKIITVKGVNVTLTGDCNTSLEIVVTRGVSQPVNCDFVDYIQDGSDFIIFEFADGTTSDNIHPECCTALGFTPEIDDAKCYYVCRWREPIDPLDCDNYSPTSQVTEQGWYIFDYAGGGEVTTVPSAECCYQYQLIEEVQSNGNVKCIEDVPFDPCENLVVVEPVPDFGIITFVNPNTSVQTQIVPNLECCTANRFNYQSATGGGFNCFNSLIAELPTVTILNETCCVALTGGGGGGDKTACYIWRINAVNNLPSGEYPEIFYVDCNGDDQVAAVFSDNQSLSFCAQGIYLGTELTTTAGTYPIQWGNVSGGITECSPVL